MANLTETDSFDSGVYQFETTDAALGGPGGVMNTPGGNLANRTRWLFNRIGEMLAGSSRYVTCTGSVNAIVANYSQPVTVLTDGMICRGKAVGTNTGSVTFTPCDGSVAGTTAIAPLKVYGWDGNELTGGEITGQFEVQYSSSGWWVLVSNPGGYGRTITPPASDNTTKTANTGWVWTNIQALVTSCIAAVATSAGFAYSFTSSGYIKFPTWLGSWIVQWGSVALASGSNNATVYFPITFPNGYLRGFACEGNAAGTWPSGNPTLYGVAPVSASQLKIYGFAWSGSTWSGSGNITANWFAVGY